MSQVTFSSSGSTVIPYSQQQLSSVKETMKKVRNCFRQLQEKLKNPLAAELSKEIQPLLHEYSPTDFSQSLKLLNATQTVSEKLGTLSKSLTSEHCLFQSVGELRGALQAYDHRLFANYFGRKSSKNKASFIHLKYPFISWCLQQAERSFKEKKIDEAQMFWSFCDRLVPLEFHQGLNFYVNEDKILRAIGLIREQLNAKKALHEKLFELVKELQTVQKSCEPQQKHLLANLQKTIEETLLELEKKYDSLFYEYRFQRLQELLSTIEELNSIEQKLKECVNDLKALHCKSLDYEILTLQDKMQVIERILSKIPYDLEKGVPIEGLLKNLSWDQVQGFIGNKQLIVKFLDLCSWMVENEDRLAKGTVLLFQGKFDGITALLSEVFSPDNLKKVSPPSQHLSIEDSEFEAKLLETMKTFSEFMQGDNIEAAAEQAQKLIQSLKKFQPIDSEHEEQIRNQCSLFFNSNQQHQETAKQFPKNKWWQIIKNALKSIGDGKLIKKKSGSANSSSIEPHLQELSERVKRFEEALRDYRFPQALAICEELRNSVRKLGAEAFPIGKALIEWVQQEGPSLLNSSQESHSKYLTEVRTTLYQTALQIAGMEAQGASVISLQCAELVGEAYLQIHERAQYLSPRKKYGAEHAISWFEMVLGENPNHASLLFKLGPLYQYLGQEEEMWRVYQEACRIQPDYFEAVNRTGCEYFRLGRRDEMLELYLESVKYPFLSDHFSINSSSQICLHRNLLQELMRQEDYERAFPLLIKLKDHLLKTNAYLYRRELDEVAYWLTLIPKEISHFTAQDFQALIECCDRIETQNACEFKIFQHCVEEEDYIRAEEYKWKILAGHAVTSERYQTMYDAQVYCQFSRSETNTKAIQMYKFIIAKWPSYFSAYYRLYHFYLDTKNDELAEEIYQKMIGLSLPSFRLTDSFGRIWKALEEQEIDPDFYCKVADHFREQHKYELAEKLYQKALEIDPYHMNAQYGIGCLFQTMGRVQEACEQFQMILDIYEAISEDPAYIAQRYFNFLIQFGNEPMRTRDREWAKTHFDEACEEIKTDLMRKKPELLSRVHIQLADLEPKEAVSHLDAAIALRPKDYKAYASKAQKVWHENPTEAVRCLQQAILCYPMFYQKGYQRLQLILPSYTSSKAALVYQTIGKGFLDQQRVEEALYNFEIAQELNPICEAIDELLGECYLQQKRYQIAHVSFVRAGKVEKAKQALNQWNRLCRFPKYGDFFKESLERIRSQLHDLKIMEMSGIATFFVSKSTEPSPPAKNKRQSILMQSQNLLNQCMQLFSTCFQQAYPEKGDMIDEFPVRRMVARQQPFEPAAAKALLIDFKEKVPELYRFLREYYEKEHEQIERFIQQANHEKHAQHGKQFLGSQTTITLDCRSNTQTTTIRPMYFDRATGKNPAEDCSQIIDHVEHLVDTIFTHLDGRLSKACLQGIIKNASVASQVWDHLVSIGWINNEGKILINTQEPLELKKFGQYDDLIIDYIRKIAEYPQIALTFETHFDLERALFLGDTDSQLIPELSSLSQDLALEDLAKNYVVKAQQLAEEGDPYQAITVLRQWSKWHQNPVEAFGLLGDFLWDKKHYYEALQAYHLAKISQPEKEKFWETRESSWGDVAFQIEEVKNLLIRLNFVSKTSSQEVLNLHAEIVAKLTHSLDHAIHSYSKTRFALSQDLDPVVLKELFFPIAGDGQKPEERVEQVFDFLSHFGKGIRDDEPEFFKYLCQIQPCIDPDYKSLGILHDVVNIEKHRRFLICKSEDKKTIHPNLCQRQDLKFYYDAIEKIEEIHKQIAYYKNLDRVI